MGSHFLCFDNALPPDLLPYTIRRRQGWAYIIQQVILTLSGMNNLLDFLSRHYHWFLFALLEVMSMVLLFQHNSYQGSVWFSSANTVAGKVYETNANVTQFFSLVKLNEELTHRNIYLEQQVKMLSEQLLDKDVDTSLVKNAGMKVLEHFKLIPAKVVSNSVDKKDNLITINKGEADGIRKDMGVVSGNGVVGIVYMTGKHYSVVIPVLSSMSSISCTIEKRGYVGYLHWTGGNSQMAYVDDIPRHAHFRLYDRVVTSGYSSVFPAGIAVGKILHVYNSSDGLSYRLQVQLYTDFSRLRDVCVIDDSQIQEQLDVLRAAQDSLEKK